MARKAFHIARRRPVWLLRLTERFRQWSRHPFVQRIAHFEYRRVLMASVSFVMNLAYVGFNSVLALASGSLWHGALGGFYALLTVMRGILLFGRRQRFFFRAPPLERERCGAVRKYRICGWLLSLLPIFLAVAVWESALGDYSFAKVGGVVSVAALYAVYKVTAAIINVVRSRRSLDLTVRALCNISLAEAAVSVLSVQTALLTVFAVSASDIANAMTGGGVCTVTAGIGVHMIYVSYRKENLAYGAKTK